MFEKDTGIEESDERIYKYSGDGEKIIINFIKWRVDEVLVKKTNIYDEGTDEEEILTKLVDSSKENIHLSTLHSIKKVLRSVNTYEKNIKRIK